MVREYMVYSSGPSPGLFEQESGPTGKYKKKRAELGASRKYLANRIL